jgi:hypothetical protein
MPTDSTPPEEDMPSILEEAAAAKDRADKAGAKRTRQIVTGAAIGIGSAALVAALLYANRARKTDKGDKS